MPRLATAPVIEKASPEPITNAQLALGQKKLARLRANLKAIRHEISSKLLSNVEDCRNTVNTTMDAIGEIHVAFDSENK